MEFKYINTIADLGDGRYDLNISAIDFFGYEGDMDYTYSPDSTVGFALDVGQAIQDWMDAGKHITPYVAPPPPTLEEVRASMRPLTPREFREVLIDQDILTDAVPDEVSLAISQIPFDKERAKALNAWQNPTQFTRTDPYIDMIGAMFNLTPEQIDQLWEDKLAERDRG